MTSPRLAPRGARAAVAAGVLTSALVAAALTGCSSEPPTYPRIAGRAIVDTPVEMLSIDDLGTEVWSATPAADEGGQAAWIFGAEGMDIPLEDEAEDLNGIDAASVESIVLEMGPSNHRGLRLRWGSEDTLYGQAERAIGQRRSVRGHRVQFQLAGLEGWSGTIDRLHIEPLPPLDGEPRVALRRAGLTARGFAPEAVAERGASPLWVDLQSDVRAALVTAPGHPVEAPEIDAPADGTLRFAVGGLGRLERPVTAQVDDAASGDILWRGTVDPERFSQWTEIEVAVEAAAAPRRLRFSLPEETGPLPGVVTFAAPEIVTNGPNPEGAEAEERPWNVVLVSIDTMRADRLGFYGAERPVSPRLDEWVERPGVTVFEQATAQASWTLPSHTSMLSGLDALHHGVNYDRPAPQRLEMLGEILRRAGRETFAVTGGAYLHPKFGLAQGFDRWIYWRGRGEDNDEIDRAYEHAVSFLDAHGDEPFFLFFHTYDMHHREVPRAPFYDLFGEDPIPEGGIHFAAPPARIEEGFKKNRAWELEAGGERFPLPETLSHVPSDVYDSRVGYMDLVIGRLLDQFEDRDLLDRTVIVLTSDHGELFGEHGQWGHLSLWEENTHVPLVIYSPESVTLGGAGGRVARQVRSIDIVPTICDLLGLEPPPSADGRSLRALLEGEDDDTERPAWTYAAASNHGLALRTDEGLKAHFNNTAFPPARDQLLVFRLDSDPEELRPLADDSRAHRLREVLARNYLTRVPMLRLQIVAGPDEPLSLRLHGTMVRKNTTKAPLSDGGVVQWLDDVGVIGVTVGVDETLILGFEDIGAGAWIEAETPAGRTTRIDFAEGPVVRRSIDGFGWRPADTSEPGFRGLLATWVDATLEEDGVRDVDDEIRDRLEALGYL